MIPDNELSPQAVFAPYSGVVRGPIEYLHDYEKGGIALGDGSQGLQVQLWECRVSNEVNVEVSAPNHPWSVIYTHTKKIEQVGLAFDNNMRPFLTMQDVDGDCWYWYWDVVSNSQELKQLPAGSKTPRCCVDDHRESQNAISDVVLSYVRAGSLYARYQRERYENEHLLQTGLGMDAELVCLGMNRGLRLQWQLRNAIAVSGAAVFVDPFLGDIVKDLCRRSNVRPQDIDVSRLYENTVEGYRIANQGGADANIAPLQSAWFFDPGEWDKKLRFIPRGGEPVAHITYDDLLEREGNDGPLQMERVQQIELLRKVNVTMVDSTAGWVANKQTAERRSATIKAVGESSVVLPITAHPDFTATVAMKRLRVPWGEPHKFRYGLGIPWSRLTATDVVTVTDRRGRTYQTRIAQIDEDYGNFQFEVNSNARWIYETQAKGVSAPPSIPTIPGQAGDTIVVPINIPVFRDQDDEFGYYVAVRGTGNGWSGGLLQISLDGGATVLQSLDVDVPATIGETVTALLPEASSEYLSQQTLRVTLPETPESISRADVLRYRNMAAVERADGSWEVLQWQVATPVDETTYDLSGLVRGRYATEPLAVAAGGRFVLLDSAVIFVQLQQWMLGETVSYRGVTYNQNADDVPWESFTVDDPQSQREWPVHYVRRNGDTVSWVGRARLGVEVAPHNSKYFAGYRVTYSDGYTADTTEQTYTRAGTPVGVTVTVAAINTITGLGPASEGITV